MRQSTKYSDHAWLARCRYDGCSDVKVKCPVCKKPGHVTTHTITRDSNAYARITIQHAHFLENVDAGRNMFCETSNFEQLETNHLELTYRLKPEAKKRLIEVWTRRLSK